MGFRSAEGRLTAIPRKHVDATTEGSAESMSLAGGIRGMIRNEESTVSIHRMN